MSHEILTLNDQVCFARLESSPKAWHEGSHDFPIAIVPDTSDLATLAAASHVTDRIIVKDLYQDDGTTAPGCRATYRIDPVTSVARFVAPVGPDYTVTGNGGGDRMVAMLQPLIDKGLISPDTSMLLKENGSVAAISCTVRGAEAAVKGKDRVRMNLVTCQGFDGKLSYTALLTQTRVVCANTMAVALGDATSAFRARHNPNVESQIQALEEAIAAALPAFTTQAARLTQLSETPFTMADWEEYARSVFPTIKEEGTAKRKSRLLNDLTGRFEHGIGNEGKTAWDALNAITEYTTHGRGRTVQARQADVLIGASRGINERALYNALEMSDRILQLSTVDGRTITVNEAIDSGLAVPEGSLTDYLLNP